MTGLTLHPTTEERISDFIKRPSHALVLSGAVGIGKSAVAIELTEKLLNQPSGGLAIYPYVLIIEEDSVGIEAVRKLEHFLSLKVPPLGGVINRAVIINNAQELTHEAQNALLKTLEEPPKDTIIILSVSHPQALLPTIRSRSQMITIVSPPEDLLINSFTDQGFDEKQVKQAFLISGGLPGLMNSLLNEESHPLAEAVESARALLNSSTYEKLLLVDGLSKQKQLARDTVTILERMADISLQSVKDGTSAKRWQKVLEAAYDAENALERNAQPKLVLTDLALSI